MHNGGAWWDKLDPFHRLTMIHFIDLLWKDEIRKSYSLSWESELQGKKKCFNWQVWRFRDKWSKPWGPALPQILLFLRPHLLRFLPFLRLFKFIWNNFQLTFPYYSSLSAHYITTMEICLKCKFTCCLTSLSTLAVFSKGTGKEEAE